MDPVSGLEVKTASPSISGSDRPDPQPLTSNAQSSPVPEAVEEAEDSVRHAAQLLLFLSRQQPNIHVR